MKYTVGIREKISICLNRGREESVKKRDRFSRPTYKAMEKRPGDEVEIMPKIMLAQPIKAYPGNEVCPTGGGKFPHKKPEIGSNFGSPHVRDDLRLT